MATLNEPEQAPSDARPLVVVGLGASAGGIDALKAFFASVSADSSAAYVVILHLSPDHDSRLAQVLQPVSPIPIAQVTDTVGIRPDHGYVVPPNKSLSIVDNRLTLSEFSRQEHRRAPVDIFFRALAETEEARAVCVILSGTGPDGSMGLKRIKEHGGLVVAQDPNEAEYGDMPRNAIATGLVDTVLPVAAIPAQIASYAQALRQADERAPRPADGDAFRDVLTVLKARTGHDFSNYKGSTLQRRISRRMNLFGIDEVAEYARFVSEQPDEAALLMKELLISVTNFFRDRHAWLSLEQRVIPRLFLNKTAHDHIRVWVPGCATGEEAYSVAILLAEQVAQVGGPPRVQIFGTDLDQHAIEVAREGIYSEAALADIPPERLRSFFVHEADGFRVRRDLRELVLFATHNLIKDPPFSHLDLVCCRNLLIYFTRAMQQRVIETFHFALRPAKYLFLGASETPDGGNDLFVRLDPEARIYESRTVISRVPLGHTEASPTLGPIPHRSEPPPAGRIAPADLHQRLLETYAAPSVLISDDYLILHMSDRVGRFFQVRGGEPSRELLPLVRPELRADLRTALYQAATDRADVQVRGIAVPLEDGVKRVTINVKPVLREGEPARGFFLVMFDEAATADVSPPATLTRPAAESVTGQLEQELAQVKAQLRHTIEHHETQDEEAKASNEELQAMNEELRSAAEELETTKEELQSLNEELTTVNQELKIKIEELGLTNNDFQNFIKATDIGTIFLDVALRVKFFTPSARRVFNLLDSDLGRPLSDITSKLRYDGIHADVRQVLDHLANLERQIETEDQRSHLVRILPYRTTDNRILGVVITFHDITERRTAQLHQRQADERLRLLIEGALDYAIFTMRDDGVIDSWNPGAQRMFGYEADEIVGVHVGMLFTAEDRAQGLDEKELAEARRTGRASDERFHVRKDGSLVYCSGVTRRLGGGGLGLAKIARDLTAQRELDEKLARAQATLETSVKERTAELEAEVRGHHEAKLSVINLLRRLVSAEEDQRRRIAGDLHDHVGQQLTLLRLALERAGQADAGPREEIAQALALTGQLGRDLDFLAWELRPGVLDELGLVAALPRFVNEWAAHVGVHAEVRVIGYQQGQLPHEAEVTFYRVTQEALNNVAKYARASRVDVVLTADDGHVVLVIEDDGIGFDPSAEDVHVKGFGLVGMRERAALVGATFQIESTSGRGTAVYLRRSIQSQPDSDLSR